MEMQALVLVCLFVYALMPISQDAQCLGAQALQRTTSQGRRKKMHDRCSGLTRLVCTTSETPEAASG